MNTTRVETFSDGVFAIVITLLILEIKVPAGVAPAQLTVALMALLPKFLVFILSFIIIGVYWVAHHNMMHYVEKVDRAALWLNILTLLCVAIIPFPTALLGEYPMETTPVVFYGATLAMVNLSGLLFWWYATDPRLYTKSVLTVRARKVVAMVHGAPILLYLLGIVLAFYSVAVALVIYIAVPLFFILPNPWLTRKLDLGR
jgi:uncharacterized membrane protein